MHNNRSPRWRAQENPGSGRWRTPFREVSLAAPAPPRHGRGPVPPRRFTLHLGFTARGLDEARERAVGYVEALGLLRVEVVPDTAALSPAGDWWRARRLFCGATGPDGERCVDVVDHPGFHHGPTVGGAGWGGGDAGGW